MKYYIYIDESGSFDEGLVGGRASVVGGICSEFSSDEWRDQHRGHLEQFHRDHRRVRFSYPEHYHCGPLRNGSKSGPMSSSKSDIDGFTEAVFQNVLNVATFSFLSRNVEKKFQFSPQATYGIHLITALRKAFELLSEVKGLGVNHVSVVVAQRTIGETSNKSSTVPEYMTWLLEHVFVQLMQGEGQGVALANRLRLSGQLDYSFARGDVHPGLIAADFVCCLGRYGHQPKTGRPLYVCQPDPNTLLCDFQASHKRRANELLDHKYYGSCLGFVCNNFPMSAGTPDIEPLIGRLTHESDPHVLERELPALLSGIHQLTRSRINGPNGLVAATRVAEQLVSLSEKRIDQAPSARKLTLWVDFHIQALAELAACYNHSGAVGPQQEVQNRLESILDKYKKSSGLDAPQRESLLLEVRNRNLNLLFNDYRFEDAYSLAEELSEKRREVVPVGEPDNLLGRILGSQGQACAFIARWDSTFSDLASGLFEESLNHFASGSDLESMARNYLITTAWQSGRLANAVRYPQPVSVQEVSLDGAIELIAMHLLLPDQPKRAFDVVNYLRIAAALIHNDASLRLDITTRTNLELFAKSSGTEHPYEQWLKWLGILHLQEKAYDKAESCFAAAIAICSKYDFTMQTIGNSVALLLMMSSRLRGLATNAQTNELRFRTELAKLRSQSLGFDAYIRSSQLLEILDRPGSEWVSDKGLKWLLYTYLPFSYA